MQPVVEARRQLLAIEAAMVPHMKESAIKETVGRHTRIVGRADAHRNAVSALASLPIPVVHEPKKVN